jgi:hypothetical protein
VSGLVESSWVAFSMPCALQSTANFLTLRSHVVSVDEDEGAAGTVIRQRVPVV